VSGVGFCCVHWSGKEGGKNFVRHNKGFPALPIAGRNIAEFSYFRDFYPLWRFMLTCGPLPSLEIAKTCLYDALQLVGNDPTKLRVPDVQFTALEWAAKKGNKETVE
jgi:hypothetical protein